MFKEACICIVIVIVIILGNIITQDYTQKSVSKLNSELKNLRHHITQDVINDEMVKNNMETIYQIWEEKHDKLAYYLEHDELEKVETQLVSIKSFLETKDYDESICELDKSVFILEHIEDKYDFNLQNIF